MIFLYHAAYPDQRNNAAGSVFQYLFHQSPCSYVSLSVSFSTRGQRLVLVWSDIVRFHFVIQINSSTWYIVIIMSVLLAVANIRHFFHEISPTVTSLPTMKLISSLSPRLCQSPVVCYSKPRPN